MKLTTQDVLKVIKENEAEIRKFGVKEIYLFGSVVRGEAKETSDVDFFVVFEESARVGYFKLIELQMFLESKLNTAVDLGTKLHPALKDQVMREALRVA
jgi:predicted nucleotidyltransferase